MNRMPYARIVCKTNVILDWSHPIQSVGSINARFMPPLMCVPTIPSSGVDRREMCCLLCEPSIFLFILPSRSVCSEFPFHLSKMSFRLYLMKTTRLSSSRSLENKNSFHQNYQRLLSLTDQGLARTLVRGCRQCQKAVWRETKFRYWNSSRRCQ